MEILWFLFDITLTKIAQISIMCHYHYFTCNQQQVDFKSFIENQYTFILRTAVLMLSKPYSPGKEREMIEINPIQSLATIISRTLIRFVKQEILYFFESVVTSDHLRSEPLFLETNFDYFRTTLMHFIFMFRSINRTLIQYACEMHIKSLHLSIFFCDFKIIKSTLYI